MALALNPQDGTLWLYDADRLRRFEQYSKTGELLSTLPMENIYPYSGEFGPVSQSETSPEPNTLMSLAIGLIAGMIRLL